MTTTIEEIKMLCDVCYSILVLVSMVIVYMSGKLRATMTDVKFLKDEVEKLKWELKEKKNG